MTSRKPPHGWQSWVTRWHFARALGVACLTGALLLGGCGYKHEKFRYRLTVEVETPQGLRTGSSVIEVGVSQTSRHAWVLPGMRGIDLMVYGEAVAVDLPNGQVLFALLRGDRGSELAAGLPYAALQPPRFKGDFAFIEQTRALEQSTRLGIVPRNAYPIFATFTDLADRTSVARVDPDNLAADFGRGVKLRRITVKMTDDPVTTGISERIPEPDPKGFFNWDGKTSLNTKFVATTTDFMKGTR